MNKLSTALDLILSYPIPATWLIVFTVFLAMLAWASFEFFFYVPLSERRKAKRESAAMPSPAMPEPTASKEFNWSKSLPFAVIATLLTIKGFAVASPVLTSAFPAYAPFAPYTALIISAIALRSPRRIVAVCCCIVSVAVLSEVAIGHTHFISSTNTAALGYAFGGEHIRIGVVSLALCVGAFGWLIWRQDKAPL